MAKLLIILILLSPSLFATERVCETQPINQTTTNKYYSQSNYLDIKGIALSIATSQHHFDFGTHTLQGSLSTGFYDDKEAVSFALAKRFDRILLNASFGVEQGKSGLGIGLNWRF